MLNEIKLKLEKYNQQHLLKFYDELNDSEREHLLNQIKSIDFDLITKLFNNIANQKIDGDITPVSSCEKKVEYIESGITAIRYEEYAVLTMAGGQGTRLGFEGPKGTYFVENGVNKYIFEIHIDKLKHIYEMSNIYVPWFIMTSKENHNQTINFFEEHNYFDYPKDKVNFFVQEEFPMVDVNGKIVMDSKCNIKMGANGSGGTFKALVNSGMLDKMKKDNIRWIFVGGVDNILTPVDDLNFIGFAKRENLMGASYIIPKGYAEEKVGVFCKINGKVNVIEYIEMPKEMNDAKKENGKLLYGDAHVLLNLFNIEAFEIAARSELKYIAAFKKTNYIDENGNLIIPEKENAYKFETFIFGIYPFLERVGLLKGIREEIFAPIKNANGVDSPETASKLYLDYYNK
jgi:UDP-N-acetylglucosamine/UDP-N-acetylgalactosamine diphosphorylase